VGIGPIEQSHNLETCTRPVCGLTDEYPPGFVDPVHAHDRIQVLYACSGVMSVVTPTTSFVVPPQRAVWLPAKMLHEVSCRGPVSLRTLYIDPALYAEAPECRVIEVSDFLRALILKVVSFGHDYDRDGHAGRIVAVLLDEIATMPIAPYGATMPSDERLLRVCKAILADPADNRDVDQLACIAGMARRTFTRAFKRETGMGLAVWRQQVRLMQALSLMAAGRPVTTIAFDVGYDSPSAFTAMFRRAYGVPPSMYALP
jgi:AraC-like DNA-binding protein